MPLLLESGDYLLLESGDRLLLENESATPTGIQFGVGICHAKRPSVGAVQGAPMTHPATITLGEETAAVFLYLNSSWTPATPDTVTVTVQAPDGTETTLDSGNVEYGVSLAVRDRELLAIQIPGVAAADIADGTGVVRASHTPTTTGVWKYSAEDADGNAAPETSVIVRAEFQ
jgi:hypothetical protein